jgi:hypothetical protein
MFVDLFLQLARTFARMVPGPRIRQVTIRQDSWKTSERVGRCPRCRELIRARALTSDGDVLCPNCYHHVEAIEPLWDETPESSRDRGSL